ncbi:MAG: hypothetical protein M5U34_44095, partial [Chloroflexi bacterium]|nr:hypothetical protein [Chloroflexota bacterium]
YSLLDNAFVRQIIYGNVWGVARFFTVLGDLAFFSQSCLPKNSAPVKLQGALAEGCVSAADKISRKINQVLAALSPA